MIATLLGALGLLVLLVGVSVYARRLRAGATARGPEEVVLSVKASIAFTGAASIGALVDSGGGLTFALIATNALLIGALWFLNSRRHVYTAGLRVQVGDPLLPFSALTPEGATFDSSSLRGERVLLKFFRGEWCPFCQAELRAFDRMSTELGEYGVRVIALSKDTPGAATRHRERDGLRFQLLCDPDLRVIRSYGIEHRKALEASTGPRVTLFGFAVSAKPSFRSMAAPTTLLLDEHGTVRWIDRTDDYRIRADRARVLDAVQRTFAPGKPRAEQHMLDAAAPSLTDEPSCAPC